MLILLGGFFHWKLDLFFFSKYVVQRLFSLEIGFVFFFSKYVVQGKLCWFSISLVFANLEFQSKCPKMQDIDLGIQTVLTCQPQMQMSFISLVNQ